MEELFRMQMISGGFTPGIDVPALIAFITFGVVYLIVPVLGYQAQRRGGMVVALYLMIGYAGLSLIQLLLQALSTFEVQRGAFGRGGEIGVLIFFLFLFLKMLVFLLAMLAFVTGLRALRLRPPRPDAFYDDADVRPK